LGGKTYVLFQAKFLEFLPALKQLTWQDSLEKSDLLTHSFLLEKENNLTMYYAPHNEYINPDAQVLIVGITPGWKQMKTAYTKVIDSLYSNETEEQILKQAKLAASFSGQMRTNLVSMLDQCGLADALDIPTTGRLFTSHRFRLHTTSIIRYPVFYKGKNYTGHVPAIHQSEMLKYYIDNIFLKELTYMKESILIIPLGKVAEQVIREVENMYSFTHLSGFPHPSGANGHRIKQFKRNYEQLKSTIKNWSHRQI